MLLVLLALIHFLFPRYFKWKTELNTVSHINREMMYVHTFFIALTVFLIGVLCLTSAIELTTTPFGKKISLGLGLFWTIRLIFQFIVYSSSHWRGKRFESIIHVVFIFLWTYFGCVFFVASQSGIS
ncbi:hypothetical protein [Flavitalea sp.]|nr:hypothetical protein [Flavitalea sp.]